MGWKHREAKRKKQAAARRAQQEARASGSSARKWWLTIVSKDVSSANVQCRRVLRVGAEMVFRKLPQEALCITCADRAGIYYRPSVRWEQGYGKRRKQRRRTSPSGRSSKATRAGLP
jgi:hypothetical protein